MLRECLRPAQDKPTQTYTTLNRADVTIKEVIAGGAWGSVSTGEFCGYKVAIKQPYPNILSPTTVKRMKREASNMARMHHPNLLTFIGAVFDDDQKLPMIVIELMDSDLRQTYKKNALSQDQMLSIFKDIAYALHYLHEFREPLIHRDLTPPNVLLKSLPNDKYLAKVSDFGSSNLAKLASTGGEGAIMYSAPEAFPDSKLKQTVKLDTYSYGVLLCEVVNRKLPSSVNWSELVDSVAGKWRSLHGLVVRCIDKHNPAERLNMAEILNYLTHQVYSTNN